MPKLNGSDMWTDELGSYTGEYFQKTKPSKIKIIIHIIIPKSRGI